MMDLSPIGRNIRKYRRQRKLRQEDLAERVDLSVNYVGAIERGEKIPSLETFIEILNALEISADMVLGETLAIEHILRESVVSEKLKKVTPAEKKRILDVLETMLKHIQD